MTQIQIAILIALMAVLYSCGRVTRIEFSCISKAAGENLLTDCADPDTWREYMAKQRGGI